MAKGKQNTRTLAVWQPTVLRLTAFIQNLPDKPEDWWAAVIGTPADTVVNQAKAREQRHEDTFLKGKLTLSISPIRIDWVYSAADPAQESLLLNTLGSFTENIEPFKELMDKWLTIPSIPSITRLAFGAVLFQPVENQRQGYEVLAEYLPDLKLANAFDLLYQINRKREPQTPIDEQEINRISKWAAIKFQQMRASIVPAGLIQPVGEATAAHLELDISTAENYKGELPKDRLVALFSELVDLGKEIAIEGDIE